MKIYITSDPFQRRVIKHMKILWIIAHVIFWLIVWVQLFFILFYFFSLIVADYADRPLRFIKWLSCLIWYVYFLPLHKYGFSGWQNWVYFYRQGGFINPDFMQWLCEPTIWLFFMFFYTFLCFFYEWSLKNKYDYFLFFTMMVIALVTLTV